MVPEHTLPLGLPRTSGAMRRIYKYVGAPWEIPDRLDALLQHGLAFDREIRDRDFDVLLAQPDGWFAVPPVGRDRRIPAVLYLHEPFRKLYEALPDLPWLEEPAEAHSSWGPASLRRHLGSALRLHPLRIQARREREHLRNFDVTLVNSVFSRESLRRAYGIDSEVSYLGIDADRFTPGGETRQPVVVSVGAFHFHKNPDFIIRAIAATRHRPTLRWIANAAGSGYMAQMQKLASELGVVLDARVGVTDDELIRSYQEAHVMAYAPRLEPFGFAPLEANACATPVVALAEGGVRETVVHGENGLLVTDEGEMAAALDHLFDAPEVARTLGQQGAQMTRSRWTMAAAIDRLERHLYRACDRRAGIPR
jgi:glycosyltransferase involved in cell wall biosynthesis